MNRKDKEKRERKKVDAGTWAKEQEKGSGSTVVKLPEGVEFYKPELGSHAVDFMPYVTGENNPNADEGFEHFECTYNAHKLPSPNGQEWHLCSWACFKKPCEICKWMKENGRSADPELMKAMRLTTRHLWVVNDKPGNTKNPLKVFDTNHFNKGMGFGEMLADAINAVPKYKNFSDLEKGLTLQLTVKEQSFPSGKTVVKYKAVTRIDFLPRDYEYPEEMLDKAPCLDACLVESNQKELAILMNQSSDSGEEEHEPEEIDNTPPAARRRAPVEEEKTEETEEEETPAPRKRKLVPVDEEEVEEEEPKPTPKGTKTAKSLGLKVHDFVMHIDPETEEAVECEILKISEDGTKLLLEGDDGQSYPSVRVEKVKLCAKPGDEIEEEEDEPEPRKGSKAQVKKPPVDEEEETEEETEWEDEPVKPKRRK